MSVSLPDPPDSHIPFDRIVRVDELESFSQFQWFVAKAREQERLLLDRAVNVNLTNEENDLAKKMLAGVRAVINIPKVEREAATKLHKEMVKKEDPNAKPKGTEL
jgi:hypothetical protein